MGFRAAIVAGLLLAIVPACVGHGGSGPAVVHREADDCSAADDAIAAAVLSQLTATLGDASAIEVRGRGNVVTLTGTVADARAVDLAVKAAYAVDGVGRVENRLRIAAPPANPRGM